MYLSRLRRMYELANSDAETIHSLRNALPSDELREEERKAYMALSMYEAASRVSTIQASIIAPFYAKFLHWRALNRYVATFLPLIVKQETQTT